MDDDDKAGQNGQEVQPEEGTPSEDQDISAIGCFLGIAWIASPAALYFGLLWVLGLWPNALVAWYIYAFGGLLSIAAMFMLSMMGETMIEDIIKLVLITLGALGLSLVLEAPGHVVEVGLVAGAAIPVLYRIWPGVD